MMNTRVLTLAITALTASLTISCKSDKQDASSTHVLRPPDKPRDANHTDGNTSEVPFRTFSSFVDAATFIANRAKPRIIGFGEFHQTNTSKPVRSALERFTDALGDIPGEASDLIIETWVEEGNCGKQEQVVNREVKRDTERPPVVENQLLTLLQRAQKHGLKPHVMVMHCDDYTQIASKDGEIDYEKLLLLIKQKLAELAKKAWNDSGLIFLYGGALHNDIYPTVGLEEFSYAADVEALVKEGYVEIDLYVPEYIEGNQSLAQEVWYSTFLRHAHTDHVIVFERSTRSYIVILRKGLSKKIP